MVSPRRNRGIGDIHFEMDSHHQTTMKVHKSIRGIESGWTITDSHLSPDNERCIPYSFYLLIKLITVFARLIYSAMVSRFQCLSYYPA